MDSFASSGMKTEIDFTCEELMDTSETPYHSNSEEGEIKSSDDEGDVCDKLSLEKRGKAWDKSSKWFLPNYDLFEEDENVKKLQRAERFGLPKKNESKPVTYSEQLSSLHSELGINEENERHYRFNAIHMRGIQEMTTDDVLQYFSFHDPSVVEWVDSDSCNIVWLDDISASTALLSLSQRIKNLDKIQINSENRNESRRTGIIQETGPEGVDAQEIPIEIPLGFWRLGKPFKNVQFPFLRFAARSDKKQSTSDAKKDYHKVHSDPHYGNTPGILSQSFRNRMKMANNNSQDTYSIWSRQQNTVETNEKKNPWEELAHDWGKSDKVEKVFYPSPKIERLQVCEQDEYLDVPDLRLSLRHKKEKRKRLHDDEPTEQNPFDVRRKLPRMKMYADDEEKKQGKKSAIVKPMEDLRSKINRKKSTNKPKLVIHKIELEKSESSNSENEYLDEEISGMWALENYKDLRASLSHNKRDTNRRLESTRYESEESETQCSDEIDFDINNIGQRSPLQIEIDNDEYYHKRSGKR